MPKNAFFKKQKNCLNAWPQKKKSDWDKKPPSRDRWKASDEEYWQGRKMNRGTLLTFLIA
jgi:hypothetical protein